MARRNPPDVTGLAPGDGRPKRGRPPKVDTEKLLEVAREVFLERGIRATAAEVAERAAVSEGTLFHYFKTKEQLFRSALRLADDDVPQMSIRAIEAIEGMEIEEGMTALAYALLKVGNVALPLMMMSWSNPSNCGATPFDKSRTKYREFTKKLARYFQQQIEAGTLRPNDAEVIARVFLGSLHHYCMSRIIIGEGAGMIIPEDMFVRGLVDLLLQGALASNRPTSKTTSTSNRSSD